MNNIQESALAFVIGSSIVATAPFYVGFHSLLPRVRNLDDYTYYRYTLFAPMYIGSMSAFAIQIHHRFDVPIKTAFLMIGILSALIVSAYITFNDVYDFDVSRLYMQYIILFVYHIIVYTVVVSSIYEYIIKN